MRALTSLLALCVAVGLAMMLGVGFSPLPQAASGSLRQRPPPAGSNTPFTRPNEDTLTAVAYLREILTPAPPIEEDTTAAPPPPPPPPPPPDVSELFRRDAAAVIVAPQTGERSVLLLGQGPGSVRNLKVGEWYSGRWRLAELTETYAILRYGREQRRIVFYSPV